MGELISRTLIETARARFLLPFLEPYRGYCEAHGVSLDPHAARTDERGWLASVHRLLNDTSDDDRPKPLSPSVAAIVRMADFDGTERLYDALTKDETRVRMPERVTHLELALWAYEHHPVRFERAARRKQADARQNFWEYLPKQRKALIGADSNDAKTALAALLADHHDNLGQTRYAAIDVSTERPYETRILWGHGRAARTQAIITDNVQRDHLRFTPDRWDMTVIDHATGRLAVNAETERQRGFLREVLGRVFFADPSHFERTSIYTGRPLLERGRAALSTLGIPALREVRLRSVTIEFDDDPIAETYASRGSECVFETREKRLREASTRAGARVSSMKFAIYYAHGGRDRPLEIVIPNHVVVFDRRVAEQPIREFLVTRGFADYGDDDRGGWTLAAA
jgi:hypothetical protein